MKIFRKFTRRSPAKNKMKTIVTIIGIVLSVSLFTAVAEGLVSALNYGMSIEKKTGGAYEVLFENVDASVVSDINENKLTESKSLANVIGFADIGSENEAKPYVYIISADENFAEMAGVRLSKGRLPENELEIALPDHLFMNGNVSHNLGDKLELYVGKRQADGIELTKTNAYIEGETLCDIVLRSYTVVGFYERLDFGIENYECPGYTAITCQDKGDVNEKDFFGEVYVTLKQPAKLAEYISDIFPDGENGNIKEHTSLLMFYGYTDDSGLFHILYGFVGILFVLILFGSIDTKVALDDKEYNEITMTVCFVDYKTYTEIAEENGISIPDDGRYYGLLQDEYSNTIQDDESDFTAFSDNEACAEGKLSIAGKIDYANRVYPSEPSVILPDEAMEVLLPEALSDSTSLEYCFRVNEDNNVYEEASQMINELGTDSYAGYSDFTDGKRTQSAMVKVINVFAFGFVILISLIALANVFNTMSTNIMLRRREFAMLASVGMSNHGMKRVMNYECVLYGLKGLIYGIPVSILVSYLLYNIISDGVTLSFYIPWYSICVSVASVFVVVFATMLYSVGKIKKDNTIDALKNENL